jgi:DNA-binding NarL/FixJ family response regulator
MMQPAVVMLDLNLPDGLALDVLPQLRAAAPQARIIILTLWDGDAYRAAALEAGADAFVSKSAIHAQLLPAISQLLD